MSLIAAGAVSAQFVFRGTISGLVTDATGGAVISASVTLTDLERNQEFVSAINESGVYSCPKLMAGS